MRFREVTLHPLAGGRYRVEYEGEILLASSSDPEFDACRALLAREIAGKLRTRHVGAAHCAMEVDIKRGAAYRTEDGRANGPRFVKWRPFPKAITEGPAKLLRQGVQGDFTPAERVTTPHDVSASSEEPAHA